MNICSYNSFSFIGIVYKTSKAKYTDNGRVAITLTISVRDKNNKTNYFIPLVAYDECAQTCALYGVNGNIIGVEGEIVTQEKFNVLTGYSELRPYFVVKDVILIKKTNIKKISDKEFSELLDTYSL